MATPAIPNAAMMAGPERITRFIETGGEAAVDDIFADDEVTIVENFAPHVFAGPGAVERWARAMRGHLEGSSGLRHSFGPACDFSVDGDLAYFSLPTRWQGVARGRPFHERGGWAFVLVRSGAAWRVKSYAWAVTEFSADRG
jgi:hypothetical protein